MRLLHHLEAGAVSLAGNFFPCVNGELTAGVHRAGISFDHAGVLSSIGDNGIEHVHGDIAKLASGVDP